MHEYVMEFLSNCNRIMYYFYIGFDLTITLLQGYGKNILKMFAAFRFKVQLHECNAQMRHRRIRAFVA